MNYLDLAVGRMISAGAHLELNASLGELTLEMALPVGRRKLGVGIKSDAKHGISDGLLLDADGVDECNPRFHVSSCRASAVMNEARGCAYCEELLVLAINLGGR